MKILLTDEQADLIISLADEIRKAREGTTPTPEPAAAKSAEELRAALREMVLKTLSVEGAEEKNRLRAQVLAVLSEAGVTRVSEVPDDKLETVVEKMKGVK